MAEAKPWAAVQPGEWIVDLNGRAWQVMSKLDSTGEGIIEDGNGARVRIPAPARPVPIHVMPTVEEAVGAVLATFPGATVLR